MHGSVLEEPLEAQLLMVLGHGESIEPHLYQGTVPQPDDHLPGLVYPALGHQPGRGGGQAEQEEEAEAGQWQGQAGQGMVWYDMIWFGMVWYGMVWYGMVWYGMVWYFFFTGPEQWCNSFAVQCTLHQSELR